MAVVKIEGGVVVQRWKDVGRLDDFRAKYPDETGNIAEADAVPSSIHRGGNVFVDNSAMTVSRELADQLIQAARVDVREETFGPETLLAADEAFLTGTTRAILPIATIVVRARNSFMV